MSRVSGIALGVVAKEVAVTKKTSRGATAVRGAAVRGAVLGVAAARGAAVKVAMAVAALGGLAAVLEAKAIRKKDGIESRGRCYCYDLSVEPAEDTLYSVCATEDGEEEIEPVIQTDLIQWADRGIDRNVLNENQGMRGNPRDNSMQIVTGITLHHDGGANATVERTASVFRANVAVNRTGNARRAGYHFVIGQDGSIAHLIPTCETAAHAGASDTPWGSGANATTVAIALITPKTVNNQPITAATANFALPYDVQYEALVNLVAYLIAYHSIPPRVTTHSRVQPTTSSPHCPPIFSPRSFDDADSKFDEFVERVSRIVGTQVSWY